MSNDKKTLYERLGGYAEGRRTFTPSSILPDCGCDFIPSPTIENKP